MDHDRFSIYFLHGKLRNRNNVMVLFLNYLHFFLTPDDDLKYQLHVTNR